MRLHPAPRQGIKTKEKMREIKFRGKRLDNGEWVIGLLVKMWGEWHILDWDDENTAYPVEPNTVGQYTGLKDKNGEEIYEGDIVCGSPQRVVGEVVYHNDRIEIKDDDPQYWVGVNFFSQEGREIIGNIHDNTELLKTE